VSYGDAHLQRIGLFQTVKFLGGSRLITLPTVQRSHIVYMYIMLLFEK